MVNLSDSFDRLGIDQARLSRRTGIPEARTREIAEGAQPLTTELRLIASYLRLPADALYRINQITGRSDVRFRRPNRNANVSAAEARVCEIGKFLDQRKIILPATKVLRLEATLEDRASIEDAAMIVRQELCDVDEVLGPLCDLPDRLDAFGVASSMVLNDLSVDGASTIVAGRGLIVFAARTFLPRMLFTCAHELAHLVLGHVTADRWLIDEDMSEPLEGGRSEEYLCDVLASAILLPAAGVAKFLKIIRADHDAREDAISDTEILLLARYYGTSFIATALRLELLDLLPRGSGFAFEEEIKKSYPSVEAYGQSKGLPERNSIEIPMLSQHLRTRLKSALSDGDISIGRASETFGLSHVEMFDALA